MARMSSRRLPSSGYSIRARTASLKWAFPSVTLVLFPGVFALTISPLGVRACGDTSRGKTGVPQRIIALAPNSAEVICALGACDAVVGVSRFCVYPPALDGKVHVGGLFDPDLEKITALHPDLLVLRGRSESLERLCRDQHIPLYRDETDTLGGIETCLSDLGVRLGRKKKAASLIRAFRARLDFFRKRSAGGARPRVLLTISRQPDRLANILTAGRGTFLDEMLTLAGGRNLFGDVDMAYPQVSPESILARRPEVIIELLPEVNVTEELKYKMTQQWHTLGPMPAVINGRIHFLDDDNALIPSPRYVEIIDKVSRLLHPETTSVP